MAVAEPSPFESKTEMHADCARCAALCCVALAFKVSSDFAADKGPGVPCPNLADEQWCGIHDHLRGSGYRGCIAFDCFGAGQHVTEVLFAKRRWRDDPALSASVFTVFDAIRRIKELLWHLSDAAAVEGDAALTAELYSTRVQLEGLVFASVEEIEALDVLSLQSSVVRLLERASARIRADVTDGCGLELAAEDLSGANLTETNLRGADLRHAKLSRASLVGADLSGADLFATDLHDAQLSSAHLATALFLTQFQIEVANGDQQTTLPSGLRRPEHWRNAANEPPRTKA